MDNFYDNSSIAAASKREQFLKEAQDYNLRHQILASQKPEKKALAPKWAAPIIRLGKLHAATSLKES